MKSKREILLQLIDYYSNGNKTKFAELIGISPQNLSNWISRDTFDTKKLTDLLIDVNPYFVLTGEGEMLRSGVTQNNVSGDNISGKTVKVTKDSSEKFLEVILEQSKQISKSQEQIDRLISLIEKK